MWEINTESKKNIELLIEKIDFDNTDYLNIKQLCLSISDKISNVDNYVINIVYIFKTIIWKNIINKKNVIDLIESINTMFNSWFEDWANDEFE